jgi:hypothetical protein
MHLASLVRTQSLLMPLMRNAARNACCDTVYQSGETNASTHLSCNARYIVGMATLYNTVYVAATLLKSHTAGDTCCSRLLWHAEERQRTQQRELQQLTSFTPVNNTPGATLFQPGVPEPSPPAKAIVPSPLASKGGTAAKHNLTVVFFECCESPASQGSWNAVEIRWRLQEGNKETDRYATFKLSDDAEGAKYTGSCKSPMNCEQYIALSLQNKEVTIPEGVQYWTRLKVLDSEKSIDWQYQGKAYDGDADRQLEVLVCGSMTSFESSAWYAYTCDATAACNIVAHPCCLLGDCVVGDDGGGGVRAAAGRN